MQIARVARVGSLAALLALGACDDAPPMSYPAGGCDGFVTNVAEGGGNHVPVGTAVDWSTNPPATGAHYQNWARFDRQYDSLDRRYWLHNVEHGAVALLYNCPGGCPDIVDQLLAVVRATPVDPTCEAPLRNRMLVVNDPLLPAEVSVAAVAWDVTYTATCVDPFLTEFIHEHYNHAPENFCFEGIELGGTFITAN